MLVDAPYEAWAELEPKLAKQLQRVLAPDGLLVVETGSRIEPALPLRNPDVAAVRFRAAHPLRALMITAICPG